MGEDRASRKIKPGSKLKTLKSGPDQVNRANSEMRFYVPVVAVNIAEGIERWDTSDVWDTFLRRNFETSRTDC